MLIMITVNFTGGAKKWFNLEQITVETNNLSIQELLNHLIEIKPKDTVNFDSKNFILTKCISVQNNVHYVNLKKNVFKHSLSNIKNIYALKKNINSRYKKSLAHLSDKEKLSLGVGTTKLKILKRL